MHSKLFTLLVLRAQFTIELTFPLFCDSDASGATIYLTPNIREQSLGIFITGQSYLELPPGRMSWIVAGECTESCTQKKLANNESIYITSAYLHMHYLGEVTTSN